MLRNVDMLEEYNKLLLKQVNVEIHRAQTQIFSNITNPCMSVDIKADLLDGYVLFIFWFWYYVFFFFFTLTSEKHYRH